MAEALSKTNLFLTLERESISLFPKNCKFKKSASCCSLTLQSDDFRGKSLVLRNQKDQSLPKTTGFSRSQLSTISAQSKVGIGKAQRWWEKGLGANMKEVRSAQELVDCLTTAGDKLVVLHFFSPACGGCKALHPKICQLAEMNPDAQFLEVNYEEHKSMCNSLNVHVLPLFRFYRGSHGRLCSFSCTNATIKKFKDALAKYSPESCSVGPAKGLEEKELIALAANKDLSYTFTPKSVVPATVFQQVHDTQPPVTPSFTQDSEDKTLITSERR